MTADHADTIFLRLLVVGLIVTLAIAIAALITEDTAVTVRTESPRKVLAPGPWKALCAVSLDEVMGMLNARALKPSLVQFFAMSGGETNGGALQDAQFCAVYLEE